MAGRCDPGRPMHVDAHVVLARQRRLTGVQTDAHANRRPSRPFVGRELALRLHRRGDGARGGWKGDEEGVALGPDLAAGTARDGPPQDLAMGLEERALFRTIFLGGALLLPLDFYALSWMGMLMGLRSKSHSRAVLSTLGRVLVLP